MAKILIVEDDRPSQRKFGRYLGQQGGHELLFAEHSDVAIAKLKQHPDFVAQAAFLFSPFFTAKALTRMELNQMFDGEENPIELSLVREIP